MQIQRRTLPEAVADPLLFRDLSARLASGLAIVTCWDASGHPQGVLTRSILSLSIDPPRLLLCLPLLASAHDPLMRCDQCGVSFLSEDDVEEVTTFLDPDRRGDRFRPSRWILRAPDPPRLRRALGAAFCTVTSVVAADDHSVFVLTASNAQSEPRTPLIAFDHRLRILATL